MRDVEVVDGVPCFRIQAAYRSVDAGKLKTAYRGRVMPLPSRWADEFLDYVERVRREHGDDAPLFPDIPADRDGRRETRILPPPFAESLEFGLIAQILDGVELDHVAEQRRELADYLCEIDRRIRTDGLRHGKEIEDVTGQAFHVPGRDLNSLRSGEAVDDEVRSSRRRRRGWQTMPGTRQEVQCDNRRSCPFPLGIGASAFSPLLPAEQGPHVRDEGISITSIVVSDPMFPSILQ